MVFLVVAEAVVAVAVLADLPALQCLGIVLRRPDGAGPAAPADRLADPRLRHARVDSARRADRIGQRRGSGEVQPVQERRQQRSDSNGSVHGAPAPLSVGGIWARAANSG
jgi:hypothetical protein